MRLGIRWSLSVLILLSVELASTFLPDGAIAEALTRHSTAMDLFIDSVYVVWWYCVAWTIVDGVELLIWRRVYGISTEEVPRPRKLFTDLFNIIVYMVITGVVAVDIFHQPISGVFATSGVMAIILGLALQDTIADLFAGLALNIERPFKAGDWISVDGKPEGKALHTDWRSTHLQLRNFDVLIVPNTLLARGHVINHSLPHLLHRDYIDMPMRYGFDLDLTPNAFSEAAKTVPNVLQDPAPFCRLHEMHSYVAIWRVYFFIEKFESLGSICNNVSIAVMKAIEQEGWRHLLPTQHVWVHGKDEAAAMDIAMGKSRTS